MSIINELYYGNIAPCERRSKSKEYSRLTEEIIEYEDEFKSSLTPEKQQQCEEYISLLLAREAVEHEEMFIAGFRLCAKIVFAAITSD